MLSALESGSGSSAILEVPAPAPERPAPQDDRELLEEAGDFIARHVLEQDAKFFEG